MLFCGIYGCAFMEHGTSLFQLIHFIINQIILSFSLYAVNYLETVSRKG